MKASKKPTRREVERVANEVSEDMIRCLQSETAVGIIATARFFGLGKKRAKAYLDYLEKVKAEFAQHSEDGIIKEKITEELQTFGIDSDTLYEKPPTVRETTRSERAKKKNISIAEAYKMTQKMQEFESFLKGGNSNEYTMP